jgi:SAM-dependent methyltransferase
MNNSAAKTDYLEERIKQNEKNQSLDLNDWAFNKISGSDEKLSILELCCGTGKQSQKLLEKFPQSQITCVDISKDSIEFIKNQAFYNSEKINLVVAGLDEFVNKINEKYDLIFCSYGLYYAENTDLVISQLIESLNINGRLIILGPYGPNNESLFNLVENSGAKIDPSILYTCTDFMFDKVIKNTATKLNKVQIDTSVNYINWKSTNDLLTYWKNSTFYNLNSENKFKEILENHFKNNSTFTVEKHIMLFQGTKIC